MRKRRSLVGFVVLLVAGCGATQHIPKAPFVAEGGTSSGPSSGLWGDGTSGPSGLHVGCIDGRRFAVLITVRNRAKRSVTLLRAGGPEDAPNVIKRVAVQVRLAPSASAGDQFVAGLRGWNGQKSRSVAIPANRDAWIQSNFLMRNCRSLGRGEALIVNRRVTLAYSVNGGSGTQVVSVTGARIILARGPLHPSLPINQVG